MVRGRGIAVTAVALMYQCADTTRMARGRGTEAPNARQAAVKRLCSSAFMGEPWPRKAAGSGESLAMCMLRAGEPAVWAAKCFRRVVARTAAPLSSAAGVAARRAGGIARIGQAALARHAAAHLVLQPTQAPAAAFRHRRLLVHPLQPGRAQR